MIACNAGVFFFASESNVRGFNRFYKLPPPSRSFLFQPISLSIGLIFDSPQPSARFVIQDGALKHTKDYSTPTLNVRKMITT